MTLHASQNIFPFSLNIYLSRTFLRIVFSFLLKLAEKYQIFSVQLSKYPSLSRFINHLIFKLTITMLNIQMIIGTICEKTCLEQNGQWEPLWEKMWKVDLAVNKPGTYSFIRQHIMKHVSSLSYTSTLY